MPVGRLLERVPGAQDQRLLHRPTDNLKADWKAVMGLAARQCQRWVPAHIEWRGEPEPCLNLPVCVPPRPGRPGSVRRRS